MFKPLDKTRLIFPSWPSVIVSLECRLLVGIFINVISYIKDAHVLGDSQTYQFAIGDMVYVGNQPDRVGTVEFIGTTQFSQGEWIGNCKLCCTIVIALGII